MLALITLGWTATVKAIDWTVPEQGADEYVDVTVIFRGTDVKT